MCLKYRACKKVTPCHYRVLHLSRKIISANLRIWCSLSGKTPPLSGDQRPTSQHPDADLSRAAPADHVLLTLGKVQNPLRLPEDMPVQHPKVVRTSGVFGMFTSKCASRHSRMQLLTSHATRWLRTRHFSEPTFRPSRTTKHWIKTVFRNVSTFSRTLIFFLLTLSSLTFSSDSFSSLTAASVHKSKAWHLNFLGSNVVIVHFTTVRSKDLTILGIHVFFHVPRQDVASICKVHQFMFQRHDGCWEGNDEEDQGHDEEGHLHDKLCQEPKIYKAGWKKKNMQLPNALKLFGCSAPTRPRYSWLAVAMACVLKQVPYSSAQQNNPSTYPINKKKRWNKPKRITHPRGHSSMFTLFYLSAPSQVAKQKQLYLFQKHDVQTWLKVTTSLYTIEDLRLQLSKVNLEWKFLQTHMAKTDTLL